MRYVGPGLKENRAFMLEAVHNGIALKYAGPGLKEDRALVLEALQQNGIALVYAGPGLKEDRALVLEAVRQNGNALHSVRGSRPEAGPHVHARGGADVRAVGGPRVHAPAYARGVAARVPHPGARGPTADGRPLAAA